MDFGFGVQEPAPANESEEQASSQFSEPASQPPFGDFSQMDPSAAEQAAAVAAEAEALEAVKKDGRALKDFPTQQNNPTVVKLAVAQNGQALQYASDELKGDRAIVLAAVSCDKGAWRALSYASSEMKKDREVVTAAVQQNGSALQFAAPVLKCDRGVVLEAVAQNGSMLKHASGQLRSDRGVVWKACTFNGAFRADLLKYASDELKGDRDFMLEAVKQKYSSLPYASEQLRGDRDFMLEAVKQDSSALEYASVQLRGDRDLVLEAVKQAGQALQYASDELKGDRAIVLVAVSQRGLAWRALSYASSEMKQDREVVTAAVQQHSSALQFAAPVLKGDRGIVLEAVAQNGSALKHASDQLRSDRGVVLRAVTQNGSALKHASEQLRGDRGVVLEAVTRYGSALEYASEDLRGDRGVVLEAVAQNGSMLKHASQQLSADRDVVLRAVAQNGNALVHASEQLRGDRGVVLEAVAKSGVALAHASEQLREDRGVVLEAVAQSGFALKYASEQLQGDRAVVWKACSSNAFMTCFDVSALEHASGELKSDRDFMLEAVNQDGSSLEYASVQLQGDREFMLEVVEHLVRLDKDGFSMRANRELKAACQVLQLSWKRLASHDLVARLEEWYEAAKKHKKQKTEGGLAEPVASTSGGEAAEGGGGLGASASEMAPPVEEQEVEAPRQQILLAAANHLLRHYFNVPYPRPGAAPLHVPPSAALLADAPPPSEHGSEHGVPRPNHGLANAVRKAALVRPIAKAYASCYVGSSLERSDFALGDDQLIALEVAALFGAAGRESEFSYSQDSVRHTAYKKVSCDAFAAYAESIQLPHRGPALQALRGTFTQQASAMTKVLEVAHDLDLFRCCTAGQMRPKLESIQGELQTSSVNALPADRKLFQQAVDAIRATGDRLLSLPPASREETQDRQSGTFRSCSLGEEAPEACMRAALLLPPPARTLANSAFLRTYSAPATKPRMHFQLEGAVYGLITWHMRRAGLSASEADAFYSQIRTNALATAMGEDSAAELLQPRLLMFIAVRFWTSADTFGSREFCSLLNEALRSDAADAIAHAAAITHALNAFCVSRRSGGSRVRWPPKHLTYRGTAMPRDKREFFTVGKKYRAPMFVATSFSEKVAVNFLKRLDPPTDHQTPPLQEPTLWRFHLDGNLPERERCMQANFIDRTDGTVRGEDEFLFAPYSVFTVRAVSWHAKPLVNGYVKRRHFIDIDVASDNSSEPDDLPLAPWC